MYPILKAFILLALSGYAPIAGAADLPTFRVTVTQISESRNSEPVPPTLGRRSPILSRSVILLHGSPIGAGSAGAVLTLTLSASGESLPPNAIVRNVRVTRAVDNLDQVLMPSVIRPVVISPALVAQGGGVPAGQPVTTSVSFPGPDRDADALKTVEGTIEIYVPTESNGTMIRVANIKSHPGLVEHPALRKAGIEFRFIGDKASFENARSLMSSGNTSVDPSTGFGVHYRDPSSSLIGYMLQDAAGTPIPIGESSGGGNSSGMLMSHTPSSPLTDDMQLVIFLALPEAIRVVPFKTGSVVLP